MTLNTLKIDQKLSDEDLAKLANFAQYLDDADVAVISERFGHDQSADFYRGMASTIEMLLDIKGDFSEERFTEFMMNLQIYVAVAALNAPQVPG